MFIKKIMIDLDGVLNEYGKEPFDENYIPDMKKGAEKFLKELKNQNAELYLFTTRNLLLATKWLEKNNIDKYFKDVTNIKFPAYLYIDDRAIRFNGDFKTTLMKLKISKHIGNKIIFISNTSNTGTLMTSQAKLQLLMHHIS